MLSGNNVRATTTRVPGSLDFYCYYSVTKCEGDRERLPVQSE